MLNNIAFLIFNLGIFAVIAWAWKQDDAAAVEQKNDSQNSEPQ
jgi:hypothetical protein